jgi:hypothetical protein
MMTQLLLSFTVGKAPELIETLFSHALVGGKLHAVRGKTAGALPQSGTFQWTKAVRALSALVVLTKARALQGAPGRAWLSGDAGSLASSLDMAVNTLPVWTGDVFGCDQKGKCVLPRLVRRTNPSRKRLGPVVVRLNTVFLPPDAIEIYQTGTLVLDPSLLLDIFNKLNNDAPQFKLLAVPREELSFMERILR